MSALSPAKRSKELQRILNRLSLGYSECIRLYRLQLLMAGTMDSEPGRKKKRKTWLLVLMLVLAAFSVYVVLAYPVAKAVRAARNQQRLGH